MTRLSLLPLLLVSFSAGLMAAGPTVVIDPGHGVINYQGEIINSGKSTRAGLQEHLLTFQIAHKLKEQLEQDGFKVIMTRTAETYWREAYIPSEDNKNRALLANELKGAVFVAIHCDWDPRRRVNGVTTLYKTKESRLLGENIHKSLLKEVGAKDRHLVQDEFTVLDNALMPAVLVETGFMSNITESKKLVNPDYQTKLAKGIKTGIVNYFLQEKKWSLPNDPQLKPQP